MEAGKALHGHGAMIKDSKGKRYKRDRKAKENSCSRGEEHGKR
jgi:hypothetical protein